MMGFDQRMAAVLPPAALWALEVLSGAGHEAYVVGGMVRDAYLGMPVNDVDITTAAPAESTVRLFESLGAHVVPTGIRHGTVTVWYDHVPMEITTFRGEGPYSDHRHPDSVRFTDDVTEDLARRDFTMNAMAWAPGAGLVDPFGGRLDADKATVRCVGDPRVRFDEDPLRIMRGARFAAQLGFRLDDRTASGMSELAGMLGYVSWERVSAEFGKLIRGREAARVLRSFPGIVDVILPELTPMRSCAQAHPRHIWDVWEHTLHAVEAAGPQASLLLKWSVLLHDVGKPTARLTGNDGIDHFYGHPREGALIAAGIAGRFRLPLAFTDHMLALITLHDDELRPDERCLRRYMARLAKASGTEGAALESLWYELLALKEADLRAQDPRYLEEGLARLFEVRAMSADVMGAGVVVSSRDLAVDGRDVMARGVARGPLVGECLGYLQAAVNDGEVPNAREALLNLVDAFVADHTIV